MSSSAASSCSSSSVSRLLLLVLLHGRSHVGSNGLSLSQSSSK
jgi:hypothetical protein